MKKKLLTICIAAILIAVSVEAQQPVITNLNFPSQHSDILIADMDGDGDLDVLISGEDGPNKVIQMFTNNGSGVLTPTTSPFTAATRSSIDWNDINSDGKPDVLISGFPAVGDAYSGVFTSNGTGTFTQSSIPTIQLAPGSGMADFNNDGYTDIYIFGNRWQGKPKIYFNDKVGGFTAASPFDGYDFIDTDVTVVDFDNDGDLDLFVNAGSDDLTGSRFTKMFVNTNGSFAPLTLSGIIPKGYGSAVWGDYDGDGYLDLLLNGDGWYGTPENSNEIVRLYHNNGGTGSFTSVTTFSDYRQGSTGDACRFADWDNDGDLDIIITGWNNGLGRQATAIFLNNGGGNFSPYAYNDNLPGVSENSIEVGDIDNDGDLDLIVNGFSGNEYNGPGSAYNSNVSILIKNPATTNNIKPTAPTNLNVTTGASSVTLSWNAGTDGNTPQNSLSYNIFLVDQSGKWYYYPMADTSNGNLKLQRLGNVQLNRAWTVKGLVAGTYRWGVQAIDNSFAGSQFAAASFTIAPPPPPLVYTNLNFASQHSDVSIADMDADGDLDVLISGEDAGNKVIQKFTNNGSGVLTPAASPFTAVTRSSIDWNDINSDGKPDVLISGFPAVGDAYSRVFTSNGTGTFNQSPISTIQLAPGSGMADLNNDGYTDIYIFGNKFQGKTKIYFNNKMGGFTEVSPFDNFEFIDPDVTVVDFDNDGDLDLFVNAGSDDLAGTRFSKMFVNTNGSFTSLTLNGIIPKGNGSAVWGDYDGDGYLDLLLNGDGWYGTSENSNEIVRLYHNNGGTGSFTSVTTFNDYRQGSTGDACRFADWDNDGDLDIIISGWNNGLGRQATAIFLNNSGGNFSPYEYNDNLPGVSENSIEVGDLDNDGDLDLIVNGFSGNNYNGPNSAYNSNVSILITNPATIVNTKPTIPTNLTATRSLSSVTLNWNAATDATTPQNALSYNIFLIDQAGKWYYYPMSDTTTGKLKLQRLGNVQLNKSWIIKGLEPGTYRWGVQTIDNSFAASQFAKSSFIINALEVTSVVPSPAVGTQANSTAYIGQTVTINGTNFVSGATVTIGGTAATSVTFVNSSQLNAVVTPGTVTGNLVVANSSANKDSVAFTSLGYISNAAGDWNNAMTWLGGNVPTVNKEVTINTAVTVNATVSAAALKVTVNNGKSLTFGPLGLLTIGGDLVNSGSVIMPGAGSIVFDGNGTSIVSGTISFYNVTLKKTVDFGTASTVTGMLKIRANGAVAGSAPVYANASTLSYDATTTYTRGLEWSGGSGKGYPNNVRVEPGTVLSLQNPNTVAPTNAGDLLIAGNAGLTLGAMQNPLTVNGNVLNYGTLSLSTIDGGNLALFGNFTNNGTFNAENTYVWFYGGAIQSIGGSNIFHIPYLRINKTGGSVKLVSDLLCEGPFGDNIIEIISPSSILDLNGKKLTIGKSGVGSTYNVGVNNPGYIKGSSTSSIIINGTGALGNILFDQTVDGTTNILKDLTINRSAIGTVTLGNKLVLVNTLTPTNGVLNTGGSLHLRSTANNTARVAAGSTAGGYVTGNVTVERFIPANVYRAWRLLSVPTKGTETINHAWQEGLTGSVIPAAPYTQYGTIITSPVVGNGIDVTSASHSLLRYDEVNNVWIGRTSTADAADKIETTSGHMLYIRGNRSSGVSPVINYPTLTTLRTTGELYTGDQPAITFPANNLALVGNIYASQIDFNLLPKTNVANSFTVWDPKVGGKVGAYVTFSQTNGFQPSPGGGSYPAGVPNTFIESGQAFFVRHSAAGTGTIQMVEAAKTIGSRPVFKNSGEIVRLSTSLYAVNEATETAADGNVVVFDNAYSNAVDGDDAVKMTNIRENLGISKNDVALSVEGRKPVGVADTIFLKTWNLQQQDYKLQFVADNMNVPGLTAILEDKFLHTKTPISLADTTYINFTITNDPASFAEDRFRVVFKSRVAPLITLTAEEKSKFKVTPNPVQGRLLNIAFVNQAAGHYAIRLINTSGQVLYTITINHSGERTTKTVQLPSVITTGVYNLEITGAGKAGNSQNIIISNQ